MKSANSRSETAISHPSAFVRTYQGRSSQTCYFEPEAHMGVSENRAPPKSIKIPSFIIMFRNKMTRSKPHFRSQMLNKHKAANIETLWAPG